MEMKRKQPIGVELVKRGLVTEGDIEISEPVVNAGTISFTVKSSSSKA